LTNYNSTPIGKVSMNALNMAVAQMVEKLNLDPSQQWFSRVQSFASSSQIIINSGSSANISVGDEFNIFNVVHTRPCLTGDQVFPSPDFPIGTAVVTSVNSTYSVATVKLKGAWVPQIGSEIRPLPGAKKLYKRSAALGGISSKPLGLGGSLGAQTACPAPG
jgi:hypothetical protein